MTTHHQQNGNYPDERQGESDAGEEFSPEEREHERRYQNFKALEAVRRMRAKKEGGK